MIFAINIGGGGQRSNQAAGVAPDTCRLPNTRREVDRDPHWCDIRRYSA
jgi:hypothetical protein